MTIGSKQAQVNGSPLEMDVAPYIENGRTYIPVRYMAEFFGQTVEWVGRKQQVAVCENKAAVQPSNLEAWALPMGAMLNHMNNAAQETLFGGKERWGSGPVGKPGLQPAGDHGPGLWPRLPGRQLEHLQPGGPDRDRLLHDILWA